MQTDDDKLFTIATGRTKEMFVEDLIAHDQEISDRIEGSRVLVIGGAGSIGSMTVRMLCGYRPEVLHIVDLSENNLAELVRDLRSNSTEFKIGDFRTFPIDYGSPLMCRLLEYEQPYDFVLNFAALKHVRTEKDVFSSIQMLDTNVVKQARLLNWISKGKRVQRYFSVSTDKAANPVNLMGASKRIMEHVMFSGIAGNSAFETTSARFANVAFSDGSLLDGIMKRIEKRQLCAVPEGVRRYFITQREAGTLCLLAAFFSPNKHLLIPRLSSDSDLRDLVAIVSDLMAYKGFEPCLHRIETRARRELVLNKSNNRYPILVTRPDTTGEKSFEEFIGREEKSKEIGLADLQAVEYLAVPKDLVLRFLEKIENLVMAKSGEVTKEELIMWVSALLPEFEHIETGKYLDGRI